MPSFQHPDLLVGLSVADDAAAYSLDDDTVLIHTVDFFTPIVDDARDYGAIAAANALSDVYAMGGEPLIALNIVAWPMKELGGDLLGQVLAAGAEIVKESGALLAGGHSVEDDEPKYGLAVVGRVSPERLLTIAGGRPGDQLVLTKPIGSGIAATAVKRGLAEDALVAEACTIMRTLNRDASRAAGDTGGVTAATDITGYGLLGHLWKLCEASGVGARIHLDAIPEIAGTRRLAAEGVVPGGSKANLEAIHAHLSFDHHISDSDQVWLADAQTSGGLLLAVDPDRLSALLAALNQAGTPAAEHIGELVAATGRIDVMP